MRGKGVNSISLPALYPPALLRLTLLIWQWRDAETFQALVVLNNRLPAQEGIGLLMNDIPWVVEVGCAGSDREYVPRRL